MLRYFIIFSVLFSIFLLPVYAQVTCTAQTFSNGTVITCPNQNNSQQPTPIISPTTSSSPSPSNTIRDYFSTILGKLQSASQQSGLGNSQFNNMTSEAGKAVTSAIDLFGAIKYLLASLIGLIAPIVFHQQLPNWVVPLFIWGMLAITAWAILKHIWKIVMIGAIFIVIIFIVVLFGSNFFLH